MAVKRAPLSGDVSVPPPSPIPTAKGVRSAANEILSRYLEKSVHVPDLHLPEVGPQYRHGPPIPEEVDLAGLAAREAEAVEGMMRSARETGAVRVRGHGIGREELKAVVRDVEWIFRVLEERDTGFRQNFGGDREEIIWVGSQDQRMAWAREYIGPQLYQTFSEKMEDVERKLEKMAEIVNRIFTENAGKQHGIVSRGGGGGSVLSIYRYNHDMIVNNDTRDDDTQGNDYVLNLHLPAKRCEFRLQSSQQHSSFDAGPENIIITVGKQLEEMSMGELKSVSGRIIYEQDFRSRQASFSIELKWSPLKLSCSLSSVKGSACNTTCSRKIISLQDQLLVALITLSIYSVLFFKS